MLIDNEDFELITKILDSMIIIPNRDCEGKYRPIKNTSTDQCYKSIVAIKDIIEKYR